MESGELPTDWTDTAVRRRGRSAPPTSTSFLLSIAGGPGRSFGRSSRRRGHHPKPGRVVIEQRVRRRRPVRTPTRSRRVPAGRRRAAGSSSRSAASRRRRPRVRGVAGSRVREPRLRRSSRVIGTVWKAAVRTARRIFFFFARSRPAPRTVDRIAEALDATPRRPVGCSSARKGVGSRVLRRRARPPRNEPQESCSRRPGPRCNADMKYIGELGGPLGRSRELRGPHRVSGVRRRMEEASGSGPAQSTARRAWLGSGRAVPRETVELGGGRGHDGRLAAVVKSRRALRPFDSSCACRRSAPRGQAVCAGRAERSGGRPSRRRLSVLRARRSSPSSSCRVAERGLDRRT